MREIEVPDPTQLSKKLHDLESDRTYKVYIWARTAVGRGPRMDDEAKTRPHMG